MFAGLQGGGGSGFGLYICKGIVDLHNGLISVFSEGEGLGSTFTVQLPMQQPSKKAHDPVLSRRLEPIVADLDRSRSIRHGVTLSQKEIKPTNEVQAPAAVQNRNSNKSNSDNNNYNYRGNLASSQRLTPPQQQQQVSYRVLMVDDSAMNRKMLGKLLKSVGHDCDEANDGDVAVAKVTPDCRPLFSTTSPVIAL